MLKVSNDGNWKKLPNSDAEFSRKNTKIKRLSWYVALIFNAKVALSFRNTLNFGKGLRLTLIIRKALKLNAKYFKMLTSGKALFSDAKVP